MNKKLMITAAALLAFTSLVGCNIKTGGNTGSSGDNTSSADDPSSSSQVPDTKCTVTFDLNYQGAPAATTVEVEKGDYVNEPEEPTRENYYFNGWFDTQDASGDEFDFTFTTIEDDLTLYADWSAACTVTFYLNEPGKEQAVYKSETVKSGKLVTRPADPKITGYSFGGWFNTADCNDDDEFSFTSRVTSNKEAYAKWNEPDWKSIKTVLDKYFGFISEIYGATVPQFPNSDYEIKEYMDCVEIKGPDTCIADYLPILEAAGYTVDAENNKANNDYIELQFGESEEKGFQLLASIKGAGEQTTFNPLPYQVGTQQNYLGLPETAIASFTKFETYKVSLTTGDPAARVSMYLEAKPADSTLSDQQYWSSKVTAFLNVVKSKGYKVGTFTDSGGYYFYDVNYFTMNQVTAFDESTPLVIELLSYSYGALYGSGVGLNKITADAFANAVKNGFATTASLDVDFSTAAASYAVNKKNFIIEYDADDDYIEVDVFGINGTSYTPLNQLATAVLNSIAEKPDWGVMRASTTGQLYQQYYAYHYAIDQAGKKSADAKMVFDYSYNSSATVLGAGALSFQIILNPAESSWNEEAVADYLEKQALPGDETALPAYTGEFAVIEMEASEYGDTFDIYMLYTNQNEALAYKDSLIANNGYVLDAAKSDAEQGQYVLVSASGNFEVALYISEDSVEIVINAAVEKSLTFGAEAFATLNELFDARNGFEFSADAQALLTATYTDIEYYSFFNTSGGVGYTDVTFVSNVASVAEGDPNPVEADVNALIAYYVGLGYTKNAQGAYKKGGTTLYIELVKPEKDGDFFALELVVLGNNEPPLDGGHCVKVSDAQYIADNGDAFVLDLVRSQIKAKFPSMETPAAPSLYSLLTDASTYVSTTLEIMTNLESYKIYYYNLANEFTTAEAAQAAASAYIAKLTELGFVGANFTALSGSPEGYWYAGSGEFVTVSNSGTTTSVRIFFLGAYRTSVVVK